MFQLLIDPIDVCSLSLPRIYWLSEINFSVPKINVNFSLFCFDRNEHNHMKVFLDQQFGDIVQLEGVCAPLVHKVGEYACAHFVIYTFVLDIYCQQLRDICQFEGVCASFGHKVGE